MSSAPSKQRLKRDIWWQMLPWISVGRWLDIQEDYDQKDELILFYRCDFRNALLRLSIESFDINRSVVCVLCEHTPIGVCAIGCWIFLNIPRRRRLQNDDYVGQRTGKRNCVHSFSGFKVAFQALGFSFCWSRWSLQRTSSNCQGLITRWAHVRWVPGITFSLGFCGLWRKASLLYDGCQILITLCTASASQRRYEN